MFFRSPNEAESLVAPSLRTDVLIVGAGPTGLMLANQLARRGVRPLIIDRSAGPSIQTKALGVQARTLEIYSHLGIAERAIQLGRRATGANMWVGGRRRARVPFGDIGRELSPYPFLLILGQDDNERLLGEVLGPTGIDVRWNTELTALSQSAESATATARRSDGAELEIRAAWVAGCDGARSAVRELSGIGFPGAPYEHVFFVADTRLSGTMVPDELNVYLWRGGFYLLFPMRGTDHWRAVGILPPALRGKDDVTFDAVFPGLEAESGSRIRFHECTWFSTYRIHHRRAERFRNGRCFLLGDAAHVHSPVGAQGMNTGLQDAYNFAWKLALVISGTATDALLDSYAGERMPVAERLLRTTDRAFAFVVSEGRMAGLLRAKVIARVLAFAMGFQRVRRVGFRTISQIGIRYARSSLSQTLPGLPAKAARGGDRFPWVRLQLSPDGPPQDLFQKLDDTRFNLLLIGSREDAATDELKRLMLVHTVPDTPENRKALGRAGIPFPSFYLLRPDGYIALAGSRLEGGVLEGYLASRLGLKRARENVVRTGSIAS